MGRIYACVVGAFAVLFVALDAGQAAAVTRTFGLTGVVTATGRLDPKAPDFTGVTGTGSFGFDSSLITGSGDEILTGGDLDLDFTIFGQSFTEADDLDFDVRPALFVRDGNPRALDFFVVQKFRTPTLFAFFISPEVDLVALGPESFGASVAAVSQIPLPAALPLALGGIAALGLLGLRRRRAGA
jgi:hypothetical protein